MFSTSSLEKLFFHYILENPQQFYNVPVHYFENEHIKYVYDVVKSHYDSIPNPIVPSPEKITELVKLNDKTGSRISPDVLKTVLTESLDPYQQTPDDNWLQNEFSAWVLKHSAQDKLYASINKFREVNDKNMSLKEIEEIISDIRENVNGINLAIIDEDMGVDFDDPTHHEQDTIRNKVSTGWTTVDNILNGGWDLKTLNMFMGQSNVGKSVWMCNCAGHAANNGRNVLYVSLEMSEKKILKRIGSMRMRIPISEYDNLSRDRNFMKGKIQELHYGNHNRTNLFEQKVGKLFVKEFPSGSLTVHQLDDYVKKLQRNTGVKLDMIIIDYLTLMNAGKNMNENLYLKGKALAEGVRAIAQKYSLVAISATQIAREAFNANNISMKDMSESKAILETSDSVFGIIQDEQMKKDKIYWLKCVKNRDGEFKWSKARFEVDWRFMLIHNDSVIE